MRLLVLLLLITQLIGCNRNTAGAFPENQHIDGPFEIGTEWQTIRFAVPLKVDHSATQGLHLFVDRQLYLPNSHYDIHDTPNQSNLRRNDGVLIKPEVRLVGPSGDHVTLTAVSNIHFPNGELTIGFGTFAGQYAFPPPFPEVITEFTAVQVRSNEPFIASSLQWRIDHSGR
jgi:hypothetical protein